MRARALCVLRRVGTDVDQSYPIVTLQFVGIALDPAKADAEGFVKKIGTSMPEIYIDNLTYAIDCCDVGLSHRPPPLLGEPVR